jgi:hypothetical protein
VKDTAIIAAIAPDAVSLMDKAIAEIKRLRQENATLTAERDEARREVCQWEHHWDKTSSEQYYADKRGWDCFNRDTLSQEVSQEGCKEKQ